MAASTSFAQAVEVVRGGFATPTRFDSAPGPIAGCVYRADGTKVELSERFGGHRGDWMVSDNPARAQRPTGARSLPGRGVYLGHDMGGHYGHFITEGLSAFWIFEEQPPARFDYFLLHPFIFGGRRPAHVRACLERFEIAEERVVCVGEPLILEELVVPERLVRLNHSADERMRWVYGELTRGGPAPEPAAPRVYLSRRRLSRRRFDRVVANEARIETLFRRHGFTILYPESMPFVEQLRHYRHAEVLAGLSGSALHNSVFLRPGRQVIELGDPRYGGERAPNQAVCDALAGARTTFVPFAGRRFGPKRTMLFDLRVLAERLAAALGEPPAAPPSRLRGLLEVAYLAVRPTLGHWAARILGRR